MPFILLAIFLALAIYSYRRLSRDGDDCIFSILLPVGAIGALIFFVYIFCGTNSTKIEPAEILQINQTPYEVIVYIDDNGVSKRLIFDKFHEVKTIESGNFSIEKIIPINYIGVECTSQTKFKVVPKTTK